MKQLKDDLKTKNFKKVYLFFGEERYLKNYYETKFKDNILEESFKMMNLDIFEGKQTDVQKIIDSSNTAPFMSEKRLVIIKASGFFATGKKDDTEKIAKFINDIPEYTIMLFIEENVDKRNKLYKAVSKEGLQVEFEKPKEEELIRWAINLFSKKGNVISKPNATTFIRTVPYDMNTIFLEVDKLASYKGENQEIKQEDIQLICTKSLDIKIFELVKAVGEKNIEKSLNIYNNLIIMKEQPLMVLTMVARQFRLIFRCKQLSLAGYNQSAIASKLELRSFIVSDFIKQAHNFKQDTLVNALNECLQTDVNIKTGKVNDKLAVEILLVKYATTT